MGHGECNKKISDSGNKNILVTERGASFGYNTLVSDMRSLPIMAKNGYPVIFDATHSVQQPGGLGEKSGGQREFVEYLARAAVAVGVAGVFIETHQDPDNAPSDGPNMVPLNNLESLLKQLTDIDNLIKKLVSKILKVKARQVFDSRGNPTVEAEVFTKNNSASAICPSGASTGTYEAFEKRDKYNKKYLGKSVLSAVNLVNTIISKKLKGLNVHNQEKVDALLINLDGTRQKTKLGANAMLAVSMAVKKLSSKIKKIPLYKNFLIKNNFKLPYPLMNIINGGAHANNGLRIQEFMIRPDRAKSFSDAMRICFLVINNLRKIIKSKGLSTSVGDEGGFAPMINNNNQALDLIISAIRKSGLVNGRDVSICLDVAANELFKKKNILFIQKIM